jgi:hypothetical protein
MISIVQDQRGGRVIIINIYIYMINPDNMI